MTKKLGIIGGMGSHAASWLFKRITDLSYGEKDQEYIDVLLHNNTAIPDRTRAIVYNETSPLPELLRSVKILNNNDVDVAVMACLTAYHFKSSLAPVFNGYFADPIEFTVERLQEMFGDLDGLKVGVIASTGTLRSRIFQKALEPLGATVICLEGDEQERYFMGPIYKPDGLKSGHASAEAIRLFAHQVPLLQDKGADVVIGACSEVPLVLNEENVKMPYVDVFELLAQKVVDTCYQYI
ncbi:aspartate/glutamate racemase family protein [Chitinophaga pinensis]|uniref:Aspartate racemase n=1 Tax=Chitinophaga pinensis (strain ATCC 43595 / DSM 2588 / LMG 13176 / NBRC 15968 / NCIMB 11800 / UQM 2034) TaxID=485918 RepID=A0A979G511_CHIPD|nr:amino acid racemase [Chitinophaga pinensis]ACU60871.1 aspartate racemase [Chitinophaga pinensis DSM 2588]